MWELMVSCWTMNQTVHNNNRQSVLVLPAIKAQSGVHSLQLHCCTTSATHFCLDWHAPFSRPLGPMHCSNRTRPTLGSTALSGSSSSATSGRAYAARASASRAF